MSKSKTGPRNPLLMFQQTEQPAVQTSSQLAGQDENPTKPNSAPSSQLNGQTPEQANGQTASHSPAKKQAKPKTERPNVQPSEQLASQTVKGAKSRDWKKVTYYLDPAIVRRLKIHSADTDQEQSDLVNEAVTAFLAQKGV